MDDLVNHVNDQHVKVERPDVDYQCKWEGCPRRGEGFNARYALVTIGHSSHLALDHVEHI